MASRRMTIDGIEVQITERKNCKRFVLSSRPDCPFAKMSVPAGAPEADILAMLERNRGWLKENVDATRKQPTFAAGEQHRLLGEWVTLGEGVPTGKAFVRMRRRQLIQILRRQLDYWTKRLHVGVTHVDLRDMTTRWGSCRRRSRRLTFNTRLGCVTESMIEYVVVHELCHLIYSDHKPWFWELVCKCLPDYMERSRALNEMDITPKVP